MTYGDISQSEAAGTTTVVNWLYKQTNFLYKQSVYILLVGKLIVRGRSFDSEGGGSLALFGNKYSGLENAGNK